jgi:hypothetical protein
VSIVLASLLPGLRDLRTPLVTGYLYMFATWLLFGDYLLPDPGTGVAARFYDLSTYVGRSGTLAAVSFASYLLGSLLTIRRLTIPIRLLRWPLPVRFPEWLFRTGFLASASAGLAKPDDGTTRWIGIQADEGIERGLTAEGIFRSRTMPVDFLRAMTELLEHAHVGEAPRPLSNDELIAQQRDDSGKAIHYAMQASVQSELNLLATRLQIEREALWNEYRLRSEAELRFSIFLPLVAIIVIATCTWTPLAAISIVIPFVLGQQGRSNLRAADQKVWQALVNGVIESPTVSRFQRLSLAEDGTVSEGAAQP